MVDMRYDEEQVKKAFSSVGPENEKIARTYIKALETGTKETTEMIGKLIRNEVDRYYEIGMSEQMVENILLNSLGSISYTIADADEVLKAFQNFHKLKTNIDNEDN